jgi:hypothetical protein
MDIVGACRAGITKGNIQLTTRDGGYNLRYDIPSSLVGVEVEGHAGGQWTVNGSEVDIWFPNESLTKYFLWHSP